MDQLEIHYEQIFSSVLQSTCTLHTCLGCGTHTKSPTTGMFAVNLVAYQPVWITHLTYSIAVTAETYTLLLLLIAHTKFGDFKYHRFSE